MQSDTNDDGRQVKFLTLTVLALLVGVVTGFGALVFRLLIGFLHNLFFLGELSFDYDAEQLMGMSPWGPLVILVPVVGGMGVVWLTRTFAPEAKGHGVPEVMDAIYHREGEIRPVVAVAKSLASALSIGSGAAVGREGPIIQIGSSFGSTVGQLIGLAPWQRITLLASGAGAGIAATFNTPLGGVMFAIELMLPEVSSRTFLPVVMATATATYIGRLFFGIDPAFLVPLANAPEVEAVNLTKTLSFIPFGLLCGLAAYAFVKLLDVMESSFERMPVNDYVRHGIGMGLVGLIIYLLSSQYGHYFVHGTGYGTISAVLNEQLLGLELLAVLFVAKLLATTLSLGSGASGGIFSPALYLGTTLGAVFGGVLNVIWPAAGFNPAEFAMVGMAGIVGGATGAAMTAIVMVFEMTRDYQIIVPMVIVVALAIGVRRTLMPENIYTIKLAWRGKYIPKERHTNMFLVRHAQEVMENRVATFPANTTLDEARAALGPDSDVHYLLVTEGERLVGVLYLGVTLRGDAALHSETPLGRLASHAYVPAQADDILHDVLKRLSRERARFAVVIPNGRTTIRPSEVLGIVGKDRIADSVLQHFRA